MQHVARILLAAAVVVAAGCGGRDEAESGTAEGAAPAGSTAAAPSNEFRVANVMIGKRIGANNLITEPTFQFAPADTIYVSVGTTGKSDSTAISAVWHFQTGQTVDSSIQAISPDGPENTEFHVSRPKGWPMGTYNVIIYADGDSVDGKTFAIKK